jgi:hypothetical protein
MTETNADAGARGTCCLCEQTTPATKFHHLAGHVCDAHFTGLRGIECDALAASNRTIPWSPDSTEARLRNVDKWIGEAAARQAGRE